MKKINVPEGMMDAASCPCGVVDYAGLRRTLEAALLWLASHPSQPDEDQMEDLCRRHKWLDKDSVRYGAREWQRRMFLVPELKSRAANRSNNDQI